MQRPLNEPLPENAFGVFDPPQGEGKRVTMPETRAERRAQMHRANARELRSNMPDAERWLWSALSRQRVDGLRFRRQQPIGPYIVDFFCAALKLIVELDGSQHHLPDAVVYDETRTRWLEERGYTVLRFANSEVIAQRHVVIDGISAAAKKKSGTHPE
jgi:very-short-patch-repair endonuclease